MKLKRFLFIFLALTFLAINLDSVNAIKVVEKGGMPDAIGEIISEPSGATNKGYCLHYTGNSSMGKVEGYCSELNPNFNSSFNRYFRFRYSNDYPAICISGPNSPSPTDGLYGENYVVDYSENNTLIGIAYILINNEMVKNSNSDFLNQGNEFYQNYYWSEVIANEYLKSETGNSDFDMSPAGSDSKVTNAVAATRQYVNAVVGNHSTTLEPTSLTFELKDGDYVSNLVKVYVTKYSTGKPELDKSSFDVAFSEATKTAFPTAKIEKNNEGFYVVIPAGNISSTTTSEIEVIVTGSSSYYTTKKYVCIKNGVQCKYENKNYQDMAIPVVEENVKTSTASIKGTITVPTASLKLSKKDDNGNFVPGATLLLKNSDGSYENQFISTGEEFVVDDLALGKYCLYEIEAPTGYIKSEQVDCITLSSSVSTGELVIENKKNVISISKKDMSDKKEIEGAIITILDSDKKPIDLTKDIYANVTSRNELLDKKVLSWKSTQTLNIITGLPQGTYYLEETMAPEGYGKINTTFAFTINADGTVKLNDSYSNSLVVLEDGNILTLYNEIIEQIVEVPDTAGTARTLYYVLSAVLLAAGGSLVYLVSRKEEM